MSVSQDVKDEIRAGNDIVDVVSSYVVLKRVGNRFVGLCPFHKEKTPSFNVNGDGQFYHCFGCGAGGDVFGFIMQIENLQFFDAMKLLAERIRYTIPETNFSGDGKAKAKQRERIFEINKIAARYYYDALSAPNDSNQGGAAARYLDGRGVSAAMRRKFGLGWAPGGYDTLYKHLTANGCSQEEILLAGLAVKTEKGHRDKFYTRLMFPIFDARGGVVGFGGRTIGDGVPKYLNSPDTPVFDKSRNLYGINFARQAKVFEIILVEGYMDVIALVQAGFANCCAALGTAFNKNHARELKKYCASVVLLFDSDEAGEKAVLRALPVLAENGVTARVLRLNDCNDPDDYIKAHGAAALHEQIKAAQSATAFRIQYEKGRHGNAAQAEQKISFINAAADIIGGLSNAVERELYIENAAKTAGVSAEAVKEEVSKRVNPDFDIGIERVNRHRPAVISGKTAQKGADEAKRGLLSVMAKHGGLRAKIAAAVTANEFQDEIYIGVYNYICAKTGEQPVLPAEIISRFETAEEQKVVSNVFAYNIVAEDGETLLKNVNDRIAVIKEMYADFLISTETDMENMKKHVEMRKNARKQYITG